MDIAYDHIQEEALSPEETPPSEGRDRAGSTDLNTELREAYKAFTTSPWGIKLGGFLGSVKKQGESYYQEARQELSAAGSGSRQGLTDLITETRSLSVDQKDASTSEAATGSEEMDGTPNVDQKPDVPDSLPADIVKEAQSMYSAFRTKAAKQLKQLEKAEDAADEALLKFGTNIRNFLREAVTVAPPSEGDGKTETTLLFESKDPEGRRVVHATRFDAQLHVIHSTLSSFTQDPPSGEYEGWKEKFDVEKETDTIAKDLKRYNELRKAMEKLVPEAVEYAEFWTRYYFLRHVVETEEQKRRELLKETHEVVEEEVGWDDDEDEDEDNKTPNTSKLDLSSKPASGSTQSRNGAELLKPREPRRSNEHSVADSDASYDIVSGATSRTPGSPKEKEAADKKKNNNAAAEESDDDWE